MLGELALQGWYYFGIKGQGGNAPPVRLGVEATANHKTDKREGCGIFHRRPKEASIQYLDPDNSNTQKII